MVTIMEGMQQEIITIIIALEDMYLPAITHVDGPLASFLDQELATIINLDVMPAMPITIPHFGIGDLVGGGVGDGVSEAGVGDGVGDGAGTTVGAIIMDGMVDMADMVGTMVADTMAAGIMVVGIVPVALEVVVVIAPVAREVVAAADTMGAADTMAVVAGTMAVAGTAADIIDNLNWELFLHKNAPYFLYTVTH